MPMPFQIGDIVKTKKGHPCGSTEWEILRTGMDFRIKCTKCQHQTWISRVKLEKSVKKIVKAGSTSNNEVNSPTGPLEDCSHQEKQ